MRKAVVEKTTGRVVNVIEIEEGANWTPPKGCILIDRKDGAIGDTWDGTGFMKPELKPEPVRDLAAEIDQMKADILAIKTKAGIK